MTEEENMGSMVKIIEDIDEKLDDKDTVRELALKSSRVIRRLSHQMIQEIHRGSFDRGKMNEALKEVSKIQSIVEDYPELYHSGFLRNGFQELAEAHILWKINDGEEPNPPEELGITPSSYLLGLADVVGELRRSSLDALTEGDLEKARVYLKKMEMIKDNLMRFDYPKAIVPLKHKQDVARDLVEKTRGDLATFIRSDQLQEKMNHLLEKL